MTDSPTIDELAAKLVAELHLWGAEGDLARQVVDLGGTEFLLQYFARCEHMTESCAMMVDHWRGRLRLWNERRLDVLSLLEEQGHKLRSQVDISPEIAKELKQLDLFR